MKEHRTDDVHTGLGVLLALICALVSGGLVYVTFLHDPPAPERAAGAQPTRRSDAPAPLPQVPSEASGFAAASLEAGPSTPAGYRLTAGDLMDEPFFVASDILNQAITGIDVSGVPGPGDGEAVLAFAGGESSAPGSGPGVSGSSSSSTVPAPQPGWTSLVGEGSEGSGASSGTAPGSGGSGGSSGSGGSGGTGSGGSTAGGGSGGGSASAPSVPTPEPSAPLLFAVGSLVAARILRRS